LPFETVEVYSLNGHYDGTASPTDTHTFRGAAILRQATLRKDAAMKSLALLHNPKGYGGEPMRCFMPRHGYRFSSANAHADILICFECNWIYFYYGSKRVVASLNEGSCRALKQIFDETFQPF